MELRTLTHSHSHSYQNLTLKPFNNHSTDKRKPLTIISKQDLQGKSVAVIGLGKSGKAASKLALARGASSVVVVDQNLNVGFSEQDSLFKKHGSLETILGDF